MLLDYWFYISVNEKKRKNKIQNTFYHVPTFILSSFYFTYKTFISNDIIKYKKGLERLSILYIIWSLIFLLISNSFDFINIKLFSLFSFQNENLEDILILNIFGKFIWFAILF
jgi:hypothetical protein